MFLDTVDPAGTSNFWIGLTDIFHEGTFIWTTGDALTYTNWASGEPNNLGKIEHFVHIWPKKGWNRKWNDEENIYKFFALCQFIL